MNALMDLINRGGVFYNLAGNTPAEALADAIATIPVPKNLDRESLLKAIIEREDLMPTAVGEGIAMPHPRNPIIADPDKQFVSVCFLQKPVDWQALDGKLVTTMIIILSATPKLHLATLSHLSYFCKQASFRALLEQRASREELVAAIAATEKAWN